MRPSRLADEAEIAALRRERDEAKLALVHSDEMARSLIRERDEAQAALNRACHAAARDAQERDKAQARVRELERELDGYRQAAKRERAADRVTSGFGGLASTRGIGGGISRMPRPDATASDSSGATFIKPDTMRTRMAGVCTRDSSKRNALMMCCFSTSVWLFQNSVACV